MFNDTTNGKLPKMDNLSLNLSLLAYTSSKNLPSEKFIENIFKRYKNR